MSGQTPTHAHPAWLEIDLDALGSNIRVLRERAPHSQFMAVVKADAYGHGLLPVARAARAAGAEWLGTAQLSEALALRAAGVDGRLLTWLSVPGADYDSALCADIDLSVSDPWQLEQVAEAARRTGRTARVHLKVDTGLGRNGAWYADAFPTVLRACRDLEAEGVLRVVGMWMHFANADSPEHPVNIVQQQRFYEAVALAERAGCDLEVRHLANSAATLMRPSAHADLVRPGLAMYGLSPVPHVADDFGLRPVMSFRARLALVKDLPAGQGVSYGHTYHTESATRVGLVPAGYADGVPRAAGNLAPVAVAGRRTRIAGRVCMDQFVLDLGSGSDVRPGDEVVLFGGGAGEPTAQDWADAVGTISYEIVTRAGGRLPRLLRGGPAPTTPEPAPTASRVGGVDDAPVGGTAASMGSSGGRT